MGTQKKSITKLVNANSQSGPVKRLASNVLLYKNVYKIIIIGMITKSRMENTAWIFGPI